MMPVLGVHFTASIPNVVAWTWRLRHFARLGKIMQFHDSFYIFEWE